MTIEERAAQLRSDPSTHVHSSGTTISTRINVSSYCCMCPGTMRIMSSKESGQEALLVKRVVKKLSYILSVLKREVTKLW